MAIKNHVHSPSQEPFFDEPCGRHAQNKVKAYCGVSQKTTQLLFGILSFAPPPEEGMLTVTEAKPRLHPDETGGYYSGCVNVRLPSLESPKTDHNLIHATARLP